MALLPEVPCQLCSLHTLSHHGVGGLLLIYVSSLSRTQLSSTCGKSFGKLSKRVCEPEGLQLPSPVEAMERAPQGLSPPEPLGATSTTPMQEMGLFVPKRHCGSWADSKHVLLVSDCGYILICQQILLWKPVCSDPFSDAPCLIHLHTEGQIGVLLSPWAGPLLLRGIRCFF